MDIHIDIDIYFHHKPLSNSDQSIGFGFTVPAETFWDLELDDVRFRRLVAIPISGEPIRLDARTMKPEEVLVQISYWVDLFPMVSFLYVRNGSGRQFLAVFDPVRQKHQIGSMPLKISSKRLNSHNNVNCMKFNHTCNYTPIAMDDWCDHEERLIYGPDQRGKCFDAEELLAHFEAKLQATKYGNPYPQYPTDPWTREAISLADLEEFGRFCVERGIEVASIAPIYTRLVRFLKQHPELAGRPFDDENRQDIINQVVRMTFPMPNERRGAFSRIRQ